MSQLTAKELKYRMISAALTKWLRLNGFTDGDATIDYLAKKDEGIVVILHGYTANTWYSRKYKAFFPYIRIVCISGDLDTIDGIAEIAAQVGNFIDRIANEGTPT